MSGVAKPQINIPNLTLYNVTITAPDPISAWTINIPIERVDMLKARGFIEEYKRFHDELDDRLEAEIRQLFGLKRQTKPNTIKRAIIIHQGRGSKAKLIIQINPMPTLLYSSAYRAKYIVYSWLWLNSFVVGKRPENLYLITHDQISEIMRKKREADRLIYEVNTYAIKLFEEEIKPRIIELLKKYQIAYKPENIDIRPLHPMLIKIIPISFSTTVLEPLLANNPEIRDIIMQSFKDFVTEILKDVHMKMRPIVEGILNNRNIRKDLAKKKIYTIERRLKRIGLETIAEQVRAMYIEIIDNPWKARNFVNWEKIVENMNSRLLSLL